MTPNTQTAKTNSLITAMTVGTTTIMKAQRKTVLTTLKIRLRKEGKEN